MLTKILPFLKTLTLPVDSDKTMAIDRVIPVMPAAAMCRLPRPCGKSLPSSAAFR